MKETHEILRSTRVVTFVTLLSRIFGYSRDLVIAVLLGTSLQADALVIALRLPHMLRKLMAEGGMRAAFVPVFTSFRSQRSETECWDFAGRVFWALATLGAAISVLGVIFAPVLVRLFTFSSPDPQQWALAVDLTRITFPFCLLIGLTALAGSILNTLKIFGLPASVSIYLNVTILLAAGWAWLVDSPRPAVALAVGVLVGGIVQLLVLIPPLVRRGMSFRPRFSFRHPGIRRAGRLMVPAFAGAGIYQLNVLVSTAFASRAPGWISALYYADRVMEMALGVYAVSMVTVILPTLSQQVVAKQLAAMRETLAFALRNVAFVMVPAAVGLVVLREPIVRMLFQRQAFDAASTSLTSTALLFYAVGLPAFASTRLVAQGFYALEDTATPVQAAALTLVTNVVLCYVLVGPLHQGGLALATSIASYVNLVVLYALFRRRTGGIAESQLGVSMVRTGVAAASMGVVCWGLEARLAAFEASGFVQLLVGCLGTIAVGVVFYLAVARLLGAREVGEIYTLLTGRPMKEKSLGVRAPALSTPSSD